MNHFLFTYSARVKVTSGFFTGLKGKVLDIAMYDNFFGPPDYKYLVRFSKKHKEWIWEVHLETR